MNIEKLKEIIDDVNSGNWDEYSQFFNNDIGLFIKIVTKFGLIGFIDPMSDGLQDYQNDVLYALVNENPEKWVNFICKTVINSDLIKKGDDWYLYLNNQEDLADLFYDGRESTKDLVKNVFNDDHWEPYWESTGDIYRDVVEELNNKNLKKLYEKILNEVEGETISTDTEYLEDLDDSGSDEIVITKENFGGMFEDEQTLKYILKEYASDVRQELYSLHSNCYNSAYENEIYEDIWDELSTFFEGRSQFESRPYKYDTTKTQHYVTVKIRDIAGDIKQFLSEMKGSNYSTDSLEYYGSYMGMLKYGMDNDIWEYLDFRIPDYPDSSKVDACINEDFENYF
jgi:hypothetical protein